MMSKEEMQRYIRFQEFREPLKMVNQFLHPNLSKHKRIILAIALNPNIIEEGMKVLFTEFGFFDSRFDVLARDALGRMCNIEVKTGSSWRVVGIKQIKDYDSKIKKFIEFFEINAGYRVILVADEKYGTKNSEKEIENIVEIKKMNYDKIISLSYKYIRDNFVTETSIMNFQRAIDIL